MAATRHCAPRTLCSTSTPKLRMLPSTVNTCREHISMLLLMMIPRPLDRQIFLVAQPTVSPPKEHKHKYNHCDAERQVSRHKALTTTITDDKLSQAASLIRLPLATITHLHPTLIEESSTAMPKRAGSHCIAGGCTNPPWCPSPTHLFPTCRREVSSVIETKWSSDIIQVLGTTPNTPWTQGINVYRTQTLINMHASPPPPPPPTSSPPSTLFGRF